MTPGGLGCLVVLLLALCVFAILWLGGMVESPYPPQDY